jgi:hypothetical protein
MKRYALEDANDWITGEYEWTKEPIPPFVHLVLSPAIETIDWEYISLRMIRMVLSRDIKIELGTLIRLKSQ